MKINHRKLDFETIRKWFDTDYTFSQVTRERSAGDMSFFWITHWDDNLLADSPLLYRGEFDMLRRAYRDVIADMRASPIEADFHPLGDTDQNAADLIDGIYRASCRKNTSKEAFDHASTEQIISGIGGWRLFTAYESDRAGNRNQYIDRQPIYEFNNTVFFGANAKRIDKADATRCTVLVPFTPEAYCDLVYDITGESKDRAELSMSSFANPENGWAFPWLHSGGGNDIIYVAEFYYRYKEKVRIQYFRDMLGTMHAYEQKRGLKAGEVPQDFVSMGAELIDEKEIEKWVVDKYIVSGEGIIGKPQRIAGGMIPIVPQYGDRAYIQGVEHWEGIVKAAKDPQMLRDFAMSYMADIVSRSPRIKNIWVADQIQGHEWMHEESGIDSALPYLLQNRTDANGNELPLGPVGQTPEQPIPSALLHLMPEVTQAIEHVANPGLPNNVADPDLSGKALNTLTAMFDQQSMVYQEHRKFAVRRDAEIYAAMAVEVNDTARKVTTVTPDGNRKDVEIQYEEVDLLTGEVVVKNNLMDARFEVYADIGKSYESTKDKNKETLDTMLVTAMQVDPSFAQAIMYKRLRLEDGAEMQDLRDYAGQQLVLLGIRKPETDEEKQALQQAQESQSQQQDPSMALAMAEQMKAENGAIKNQIDQFRAETDRMAVMVDAEKAGEEINYKRVQAQSLRVGDAVKLRQSVRASNGMQQERLQERRH